MGNFDLSSVVTGGSGLLGSIISSVGAKRALNKQIDYNKWAQLNQQQFNAQEAQKARDYQTQFYEQYQSPSAMVKQYQDAGLNPALAYNGGTNTPPSATSASSGMSSISPQNTLQSFEQLGGMIGNMFLLQSQIKKSNAEANYFKSLTTGQDISNEYNPQLFKQNLQQGKLNLQNTLVGINLAIENIKESQTRQNLNKDAIVNNVYSRLESIARTHNLNMETVKKVYETGLIEAQTLLAKKQGQTVDLDNFAKEWRNKMIKEKNVNPELAQSFWGLLTQALSTATDYISSGVNKVRSWLNSNPFNFILNSFKTPRSSSFWSNFQTR